MVLKLVLERLRPRSAATWRLVSVLYGQVLWLARLRLRLAATLRHVSGWLYVLLLRDVAGVLSHN